MGAKEVDISVNVNGGGVMGQAAAMDRDSQGLVDFFKDDESLEAAYRAYDRTLINQR